MSPLAEVAEDAPREAVDGHTEGAQNLGQRALGNALGLLQLEGTVLAWQKPRP